MPHTISENTAKNALLGRDVRDLLSGRECIHVRSTIGFHNGEWGVNVSNWYRDGDSVMVCSYYGTGATLDEAVADSKKHVYTMIDPDETETQDNIGKRLRVCRDVIREGREW